MMGSKLLDTAPVAKWCEEMGFDPNEVYRVDIVLEVGEPPTATFHRYAHLWGGSAYYDPERGGAAIQEPVTIIVETLPEIGMVEAEDDDG